MALSQKPRILLLTDRAESVCAWAQALDGCAAAVWRSRDEIPPGEEADVVVVQLADKQETQLPGSGELQPKVLAIGDVAGGSADFVLPRDATGREVRMACTLLAEIRRVERECQRLAHSHRASQLLAETDPLTGLANRRVWDQEVQARSRQATDGQATCWLAIADLDHFKRVNEASGYAAGDRALALAGQILTAHLRRGDLLARLGGDEFGVLLSGPDEAQARMVLERLASALISTQSDVGPLSVSIGYGLLETGGAGEAFAAAERGLKAAKLEGGNRVVAGHEPRSTGQP